MENTAKNFSLQIGSLISLYISIGALINLLFGIITIVYPDVAQGYWEYESASSSIRFSIALLVVFFPTYLVLTRIVNTIRRTEIGTYLVLTKWLIYISLVIGGLVLLGDLVAILNGFLNGELTIRFILKALSVLVVVGSSFAYYACDMRGYWTNNESSSRMYALIVTVAIIGILTVGYTHIIPPSQVREQNIDSREISDLQGIQSQIQEYFSLKSTLPTSLKEAYGGLSIPNAPEGRKSYELNLVDSSTFELCAEFSSDSKTTDTFYNSIPVPGNGLIKNPDNWTHNAGHWCFQRVVTPQILLETGT